jgi:predicted dehydrogenase
MPKTTRRKFLKDSLVAGTAFAVCGTRSTARAGANNRLRIAVAGVNGRGSSHMKGWLDQDNVEIAYLIDPDQRALAQKMKYLEGKVEGRFACKGVADVRQALDDKSLDAISVATPNHWHSLMTIWAAQAGKHVYVEKPMSHDVAEGRVCVEAQKKYGVVIQHGTQSRSSSGNAGLHDLIRSGKFGKMKISYGYCCKPRSWIGRFGKNSPETLDWNLWRGPAVLPDKYDRKYVHYNWHWFWKTGNGDMNNQGTHQLDMAYWALDKGLTHPIRAMALGGRFLWNDLGETPNTMFGIAEYPNGQWVFFNVRNVNYKGYERQVENEYYFEDGGKIMKAKNKKGKDTPHYFAKGSDKGEEVDIPQGHVTPGGNWGSFIAACRACNPKMANGNVVDAHRGCVVGHLMNNSYRLGENVPFNAKAGRFGDNKDAFEHFMKLHEIMRDGVGLPEDRTNYTVGPWLTFDPRTERHTGEFATEANELLKDDNRSGFQVPDPAKV